MQKILYIPIDTTIDNTVECPKLIKRGDTLKLTIKVYTNSVLADLTGQNIDIILKKSNGDLIEKTVTDVSNGVITATLDIQATNVSGVVYGEVQISDINGQSSTNDFTFVVSSSLANDVITASEHDIQVLNDMRALMLQYEEEILNFGEATLATEALANIKTYIDANLLSLTVKNDEALVNIANLDAQNNEAVENIATLDEKNAIATSNINQLDYQNSNASENIEGLTNINVSSNETKESLEDVIDEANNIKGYIEESNSYINKHINNSDIHVTNADKKNWNGTLLAIQQLAHLFDIALADSMLVTENGDNLVSEDSSIFTI